MDRIWIIIAGCGAVAAGVLIIMGKFDAAFVAGTLGVLAWFLDVRARLKKDQASVENSINVEVDALGKQDED